MPRALSPLLLPLEALALFGLQVADYLVPLGTVTRRVAGVGLRRT